MQREILLLDEMIDAAHQIIELVAGQDARSLGEDRLRRDALLWNFAVLGEAASQLPGSLTSHYPSNNWARASRLRNRIIHGYWSVNLEILIDTAADDLPDFVSYLARVRAELAN